MIIPYQLTLTEQFLCTIDALHHLVNVAMTYWQSKIIWRAMIIPHSANGSYR